jgi:hypothetical protein
MFTPEGQCSPRGRLPLRVNFLSQRPFTPGVKSSSLGDKVHTYGIKFTLKEEVHTYIGYKVHPHQGTKSHLGNKVHPQGRKTGL